MCVKWNQRMDQLSAEFNLQRFEMSVYSCRDIEALQELCVRLYSQTQGHRMLYEDLLKARLSE